MANAFMPSALSSLNAAGQDSLESIMKQRLFEQQMQQQMLQGQGQLNNFRLDLRQQDAQERYRQDMINRYTQDREADVATANAKLAAEKSQGEAYQQAVLQAAAAYEAGDMPTVRRLVAQFKLPVSMFAEKKKEETPEERSRRIQQDEVDRATGKAKGLELNPGLKPTRVAKDEKPAKADVEAPEELVEEIRRYAEMGLPAWKDADTAMQSLRANWPKLQQKYGNRLGLTSVITKLANVYGTRPKTREGEGGLSASYPE